MRKQNEQNSKAFYSSVIILTILSFSSMTVSATDKDQYSWFNPVPKSEMRDLSADRPDATESPITVDAGHIQIETSFIDYSRDETGGNETETWHAMDNNIKLGLTNNVDLQIVFSAYAWEEVDGITPSESDGFDDMQLRLKVNFWGNDTGDTALGIMPFIKLPSGSELSNDHVEAGVILPFSWGFTEGWGLGMQAELDLVYDDDEGNYDSELLHSIVVGVDVTKNLGAYFEYIGVAGSDSDYQASLSGGLTLEVVKDTILDVGFRGGLTDVAEDFAAFTGVTWRY